MPLASHLTLRKTGDGCEPDRGTISFTTSFTFLLSQLMKEFEHRKSTSEMLTKPLLLNTRD